MAGAEEGLQVFLRNMDVTGGGFHDKLLHASEPSFWIVVPIIANRPANNQGPRGGSPREMLDKGGQLVYHTLATLSRVTEGRA